MAQPSVWVQGRSRVWCTVRQFRVCGKYHPSSHDSGKLTGISSPTSVLRFFFAVRFAFSWPRPRFSGFGSTECNAQNCQPCSCCPMLQDFDCQARLVPLPNAKGCLNDGKKIGLVKKKKGLFWTGRNAISNIDDDDR